MQKRTDREELLFVAKVIFVAFGLYYSFHYVHMIPTFVTGLIFGSIIGTLATGVLLTKWGLAQVFPSTDHLDLFRRILTRLLPHLIPIIFDEQQNAKKETKQETKQEKGE